MLYHTLLLAVHIRALFPKDSRSCTSCRSIASIIPPIASVALFLVTASYGRIREICLISRIETLAQFGQRYVVFVAWRQTVSIVCLIFMNTSNLETFYPVRR